MEGETRSEAVGCFVKTSLGDTMQHNQGRPSKAVAVALPPNRHCLYHYHYPNQHLPSTTHERRNNPSLLLSFRHHLQIESSTE